MAKTKTGKAVYWCATLAALGYCGLWGACAVIFVSIGKIGAAVFMLGAAVINAHTFTSSFPPEAPKPALQSPLSPHRIP